MRYTERVHLKKAGWLLAALFISLACSHDGTADKEMEPHTVPSSGQFMNLTGAAIVTPPSYFLHAPHFSWISAHIIVMIAAWGFLLPIAVVLRSSRSKTGIIAQLAFVALNAVGLFVGIVYNRKTPDLYIWNAHHSLSWIVSGLFLILVLLDTLNVVAKHYKAATNTAEEQELFLSTDQPENSGYRTLAGPREAEHDRYSSDSGLGSGSDSAFNQEEGKDWHDQSDWRSPSRQSHPEAISSKIRSRFARFKAFPSWFSPAFAHFSTTSRWISGALHILILPLGFAAILTGIVTYAGIFRGRHVFNGLAHFIKGAIFFWYGILTLGRYGGALAAYGWAWNFRPSAKIVGKAKAAVPSAEFVESLLIFIYGSSNIFLEHLDAWGKAWTPQDLEHVSISIMFFGGGLCGMLIESQKIRTLLNTAVNKIKSTQSSASGLQDQWKEPDFYSVSLNPIPALVIFLLGMTMGSHHQASITSTMVHKQWGMLLAGSSLARATTYILFYLKPPTSILPSRPPTELITSFCLIAGGLVFMASNKDTVSAMEENKLDAMFVFTITMGVAAFLMAWTIVVLAIKGLVARRTFRTPDEL